MNKQIGKIAKTYVQLVKDNLQRRLVALYKVGSYSIGNISVEKPDLNYLLIYKNQVTPNGFLSLGKVCNQIEIIYKKQASIRFEFRPFRYIRPRYSNDFEISINPIITDEYSINSTNMIFNRWFTEGLKYSNELIYGDDVLNKIPTKSLTVQEVKRCARYDLSLFTIPLSRAPAAYSYQESNLLLSESLHNAKNIANLGVVVSMSNSELKDKEYLNYIINKELLVDYYAKRYSTDASKMMGLILDVRTNYQRYKHSREKAIEVFKVALKLGELVNIRLSLLKE